MKIKSILLPLVALLVMMIPVYALVSGQSLTKTLDDLRIELKETYQSRSESQKQFLEE